MEGMDPRAPAETNSASGVCRNGCYYGKCDIADNLGSAKTGTGDFIGV